MIRMLWKVMLPIVGQNLVSALVSAADVWMLSAMGAQAVSGAALAGQFTFVLTLFFMGIGTGAGVLAAQYWGRKDADTIVKVQSIAVKLSMAVSFVFFLLAMIMPRTLMRLFTPDEEIAALGAGYLRVVAPSWLAMGLSQVLLTVFKSMERTREAAKITILCLLTNIALNAVAVYGLFPGNAAHSVMGVAGATSVSRLLECALCLVAVNRGCGVKLQWLRAPGWLWRDYAGCTLPVQCNYLIWGGALAATSAIMGYVSSELVAAHSLANTMRTLVTVGCAGLGSAGSILLGKALGADDMPLARSLGRLIATGSLVLGAAAGLLLAASGPCVRFSGFEGEAAVLLRQMLWISSLYCIGKSVNSALVGGVFPAGGDTRFGLWCDLIGMWGVIVPAALLCAFVWKLPPIAVYLVLNLDEILKLPAVALRYRQGKWMKNLTRKETER